MSLDGFLTFLTLLIAAYAVMSPVHRLRLRLLPWWSTATAAACLALVIYFEFFSLLAIPCPNELGSVCEWLVLTEQSKVTASQLAFVAVGVLLIVNGAAIRWARPSARKIPILGKLAMQLAQERRFAELADLIGPQLPRLDRIARRQLPLARLHDALRRSHPRRATHEEVLQWISQEVETPKRFNRFSAAGRKVLSTMSNAVPSCRAAEDAAHQIFRLALQQPDFTRFVATYRPEFGLEVIRCSEVGVHEFSEAYLAALIANPQSALYHEIRNNQNTSVTSGYAFPEHNKILHHLFADASVAEHLGVWKPIGDYALDTLRPAENEDYIRFLNGPADRFDDERWSDPTFMSIRFFDLMVTAAECQGIRYHMWLYYFPHFVERIVTLYDAGGPDIDRLAEFPIRASRLLYEIFSTMNSWIRLAEHLPQSSPHWNIESEQVRHENDNIPKSAILAVSAGLCEVLLAANVDERMKYYLYEMVIRLVGNIPPAACGGKMRSVAIAAVIKGGPFRSDPDQIRRDYVEILRGFFDRTDHVLREYLEDYKSALERA